MHYDHPAARFAPLWPTTTHDKPKLIMETPAVQARRRMGSCPRDHPRSLNRPCQPNTARAARARDTHPSATGPAASLNPFARLNPRFVTTYPDNPDVNCHQNRAKALWPGLAQPSGQAAPAAWPRLPSHLVAGWTGCPPAPGRARLGRTGSEGGGGVTVRGRFDADRHTSRKLCAGPANLSERISELNQEIRRLSNFVDWLDLEKKRSWSQVNACDLLILSGVAGQLIPCIINFVDWLNL